MYVPQARASTVRADAGEVDPSDLRRHEVVDRKRTIEREAEPPVPEDAAVTPGLPSRAETRAAGESAGLEPRFPLERLQGAEGPAILAVALEGSDVVLPAGVSEAAVIGGALHGVE